MFKFLKKPMAEKLGTSWTFAVAARQDDARVVGYSQEGITFVSRVAVPVGSVGTLRIVVQHDPGYRQDSSVRVLLKEARLAGDDGSIEYGGAFQDLSAEMHLILQREYGPAMETHRPREKRREARVVRHFQVMSRDLQHFKALAGDVSPEGIKLVAHEEIPVGKNLELVLDFDDYDFPRLKCTGLVMWCRQKTTRTFVVGVSFKDLPPRSRHLIERYMVLSSQRPRGMH